MVKKLTLLVALLLFANLLNAQSCGFDTKRSKLRQDPNYVALEKAAEQKIQDVIKNGNFVNRSSSVLTIPVVIHVLHKGEALGVGTNISDAQIQSSIDNLNDFYRGRTVNSPLDFEIEFALAKRAPDCSATTGINRMDATSLTGYADYGVNVNNSNGASYSDIVALSSWPQTDYFNVWIVSELDGNNGGSGFQGYAYFYNATGNHGSVMMSTVFGYDPGNTNGWGLNSGGDNSTVVHELGHYFHLYHTFQGDNNNTTCPGDATVGTDSDGCADTVPHKRETSTCPTQNSCTSANWVDNNTINNIMSYYSCTDRMTADQKTRVRAAMEGTSIVSSKGATAPDASYVAPVAVCSTNTITSFASGITSVSLNGVTFNSFSSSTDGGNLDKSGNCSSYFEIDANNAYNLAVDVYSTNWQQLGVWIDWNDDGDFDDDAEQQYLSDDIAEGSTVSTALIYPSSIPYGDYVRIRLITDTDNRYGSPLISSACHNTLVHGQSEDYTIYVQPAASATWTGTTSTDWAITTNWDIGTLPTSTNDVTIPSGPANQPVIGATTGVTMNNLTVNGSLSVTSGGSLIVNGTSTGNITYNLAIADTNWHLVSSPLVGETYDDAWVTANSIAISGTGNRGISTYDNTTPHATTMHWRYFTGGSTQTFNSGIGYSNKRTSAGNYSFMGTFPTTDVAPAISQNDQKDNLIGNPYPSYLDIAAFLTANTSNISSTHQAVYVWNGTTYTNLTTGYVHPGQAFFINSNVASGTATITEAMQSHQTGVTFYRTSYPRINLTFSNGTSSKETQINYLEDKTRGLDPRYDVAAFTGVSSNLNVFTQLLEGYEDIGFETQALPSTDMETMIVPVGVKASVNEEITFSVEAMQLPAGIMVFLEDRLTNAFTRLDEVNTEYSVTLTEDINGTGRFYIHTSRSALGLEDLTLSSVSIYKSNTNTLRIVGLPQGNTLVSVFNIQGKKVLSTSFEATNVEEISLPKLSTGIYIVEIQGQMGKLSKKIIIQ